jgi:release factor glutamine methyltransferase
MIDIKNALNFAIHLISKETTARIDAEVLLAFILKTSRTYLYAHAHDLLSEKDWQAYQGLITKRSQGMPIAYLTGVREFWSLPLNVNENTLIPRPETELLVELTLKFLSSKSQARILDLGTGSGAIALALASEKPNWLIDAADISRQAISIAEKNAANLNLTNIKFFASNWYSSLPKQKYEAIISNPPYIAARDPHLERGDLRYEPHNALVSGEDGLDALRLLIKESVPYLSSSGVLLVEHGYDQREPVNVLFQQSGYHTIQVWKDIQGNDRVTSGWIK